MKALTREQIQARKDKAVRFTETVLGDPERAQEIRGESIEEYAERRKFEIANPKARRIIMARRRKTVAELESQVADLQEQVEDLEGENEGLQDQLDEVASIVSPEEEEEDEDEEDEDDQD
jgi:predicted RNase H-like nuclease (RuvC/YqgF family)